MIKKLSGILFFLLSLNLTAQTPWAKKANYGGSPRAVDIGFSIGHYGFVGCGINGSTYYHDFWQYDVYTNAWTQIANYPGAGQYSCTGFTIEGKGYVGLGWNGSASANDLWRYDTISNSWVQMANFPGTSRYSAPAFVIGHKAYLVGGCYIGPPYLNDVWVYDAHTNTWTKLNNYPAGDVECVISFAIGNHGYVGDGYWNPSCYKQMYEYDTTSDTWSTIANIPVAYGITENPDTWVIGSKAYVCTGSECTSQGLRDGWVYDTVTKAWCSFNHIAATKITRGLAAAFIINNKGYFCTGYDTNNKVLGDFWEYNPSVNFGALDTTLCFGDSVQFHDSTTYLTTSWSWSFPGGSPSSSNLQNPSVSYPASGTYTVTLVINGCDTVASKTKKINIKINPLPVINLTGNTSICKGVHDTITASGGGTYHWSTGSTYDTILVSPTTNKTYTLSVTKNGCKKDTSLTINVSPPPTITFSGNNSICKGDSTLISATGGGSYLWNTSATTSSITVKPVVTSTYSISVSNGICQKDSSIKITVNSPPIISLSGKDSVCAGNSTIISASGGVSYLWSTGATTSSVSVKPTKDSIYTVKVSNSACSKDTSIKVIVNPLPIVSLSGNNLLCAGDSTTLVASGGISYLWSTGATTSSINVKPSSTITYTTAVSNGTCVKDTSIKVTVTPLPTATISGKSAICLGDSTTLTASGGGTYKWSTSATTSSITVKPAANTTYTVTVTNNNCSKDTSITVSVNTVAISISKTDSICAGDSVILTSSGGGSYKWSSGPTSSSIKVIPSSTTTYSVTITKGGCIKDTSVKVTVYPLPVASISGINTICIGNSDVLSASGGASYLWQPSGQTTQTISINPLSSATYTVIVTSSFGCKKDTTFKVNVATPNGSVSGPSSLCFGDSIALTATGGGTYKWSTGATNSSITIKPSATTTYTVIVNNGCSDTVTKFVSVSNPVIHACCDTTVYSIGTPVVLVASGTLTYIWSPPSGVSCITCPDPVITPSVTTTYTVTGTDSAGCKVSGFVTVVVSECLGLTIPNVFTPNGDNKNEAFVINAQDVSDYSIYIYDRWGKEMYKSTNPKVYWNGKNQNDNSFVSDGVYYYIIKYTCNGKSFNKDGFVQVIN